MRLIVFLAWVFLCGVCLGFSLFWFCLLMIVCGVLCFSFDLLGCLIWFIGVLCWMGLL